MQGDSEGCGFLFLFMDAQSDDLARCGCVAVVLLRKMETGDSSAREEQTTNKAMLGNKKRRGPPSPLEKAWAMELRNQLDAQIARMFYSGGLSFNLARNPHFQQSYNFAASHHQLSGYVSPGYNKLRTTLLQQERTHIKTLLEHTRSTWPEKGVTICSDGWSDAQRRPLINFLAISEGAPMFLRAINAEGEVKTKEYISEKLIAVIEEVGARSVVPVTIDNAANCKG